MSKQSRRRFIGGAAVAAGVLVAGCDSRSSRAEVLEDYMTAVQAGDANRLRKLSSPEFQPPEIDAAISRTIADVGVRHWVDPKVQWTELVTPEMAEATVTASDDAGNRIVDVVHLAIIDDRWCVSFGLAPTSDRPSLPPIRPGNTDAGTAGRDALLIPRPVSTPRQPT